MYHSLSDGRYPDTSYLKYTTTKAAFNEHLRALKDRGYQFATIADVAKLAAEKKSVPDRTCVLTFDDGHKSSLDLACAMQSFGVSGTFFLTKQYCSDRPDFLKPDEIRNLAAEGFDFGTHGVTHRSLAHLPRAEMKQELSESKAWLENILGKRVTSMSLPAGQGDDGVYQTAYELGYEVVGNSREALNSEVTIPGALNRFVILANHDAKTVCQIAAGSSAYILKRRLRAALIYLPKRILQPYNETRQQ